MRAYVGVRYRHLTDHITTHCIPPVCHSSLDGVEPRVKDAMEELHIEDKVNLQV